MIFWVIYLLVSKIALMLVNSQNHIYNVQTKRFFSNYNSAWLYRYYLYKKICQVTKLASWAGVLHWNSYFIEGARGQTPSLTFVPKS